MAIAFPSSPSTDDYYLYSGRLYKYDGAIWKLRRVLDDPAGVHQGGVGSASKALFDSDNNHGLVSLDSGDMSTPGDFDIDITGHTAYPVMRLYWTGFTVNNDAKNVFLRVTEGGSEKSGASDYGHGRLIKASNAASGINDAGSAADDDIFINGTVSNGAQVQMTLDMTIIQAHDASAFTAFRWTSTIESGGHHVWCEGYGQRNAAATATDIRIFYGSGTSGGDDLEDGNWALLGYRGF